MKLSKQERDLIEGRNGRVLQKIMQTMLQYARAMDAQGFVDVEGAGHLAVPWAIAGVGFRLETLEEIVAAGLKTKMPFTIDASSPMDYRQLRLSREQEEAFVELLQDQPYYDRLIAGVGLRSACDYTCTPYLPEVGNHPTRDQIVSWAESSCVVYANSVLGARTHRNATIIDLFSNIVGKTPLCGFLTDTGRKATWLIDLKTEQRPHPQLLGGAIGTRVLEDVPYIIGLDRFFKSGLSPAAMDYLKEMGAAAAAIGAVGLYHVEGLTPEAVEQNRNLLVSGHKTYSIKDGELEALFAGYPVMWPDKSVRPEKCLIGCPHLSLGQLRWWAEHILEALAKEQRQTVAVDTILCAAPQVIEAFRQDGGLHKKLETSGVMLSNLCSEMYMNNQRCAAAPVITNSNKLRAFTTARMFLDQDLLDIIVTGRI
jgi:predicted aconitase